MFQKGTCECMLNVAISYEYINVFVAIKSSSQHATSARHAMQRQVECLLVARFPREHRSVPKHAHLVALRETPFHSPLHIHLPSRPALRPASALALLRCSDSPECFGAMPSHIPRAQLPCPTAACELQICAITAHALASTAALGGPAQAPVTSATPWLGFNILVQIAAVLI